MSEALRLADALEQQFPIGTAQHYLDGEAAAELRRLHAENEALREVNEAFGKRQEWWNEKMVALEERNAELVEALREIEQHNLHSPVRVVSVIARAALAKVEASK